MNIIANKTFDEERALYNAKSLTVKDCSFDGPADGESAFKEGNSIVVENCFLTSVIRSGMMMSLKLQAQK